MMVAMALIVACSASFADNESEQKQIRKDRQEIRKLAKSELTARVDKVTKKEAKRLKGEYKKLSDQIGKNKKKLDLSNILQNQALRQSLLRFSLPFIFFFHP